MAILRRLFAPGRERQPRVQRVSCHCAHTVHCPKCGGVGFTLRVAR